MTRDDAEKTVQGAWPKISSSGQLGNAVNNYSNGLGASSYDAPMSPRIFVKLAEALGILKLDEPKSVKDRAYEVMSPIIGASYAAVVFQDLESAGLKIIEK